MLYVFCRIQITTISIQKEINKMPDKKDFYSSLAGMQIARSKISEYVSDNSDH
jgi:hypothetical protein